MTNRIRIAVLAAAVSAGVALAPSAAHAAPRAAVDMNQREAHHWATAMWHDYFALALADRPASHVGRCHGGPKVWYCPATASGDGTHCTATIKVWTDPKNVHIYWQHLRCRAA